MKVEPLKAEPVKAAEAKEELCYYKRKVEVARKAKEARKAAEAKMAAGANEDNGYCSKGHKLIYWVGMPDDPAYRRAHPSRCSCSLCPNKIYYSDPKGFRRCKQCQYDAHHECQEALIKRKV